MFLSQPEQFCEWPPKNQDDVVGKVVIVKRGGCNFIEKVMNAEDSGALGVVVYGNDDGPPIFMGTDQENDTTEIGIPSAFVEQKEGLRIVARLKEPLVERGEVKISFKTDFETTFDGYLSDRQQYIVDFSGLRGQIPPEKNSREADGVQSITMTTAGGEKVVCSQREDNPRGNRMEAALKPLHGTCLFHHDKQNSLMYELCYGKHFKRYNCSKGLSLDATNETCHEMSTPYVLGTFSPQGKQTGGSEAGVSALRTHSHLYSMGDDCNTDAEVHAKGSCSWLGEEMDKFKAWEKSCVYFSEDQCETEEKKKFCRWTPAVKRDNFKWRYDKKASAMVWFQCAIGGLHEISVVNKSSACHYGVTVETPLVCSEEGHLKQGPGEWSKWVCTPKEPLSTIPVVGQWKIRGSKKGNVYDGSVTVTESKPMDSMIGMKGYLSGTDAYWTKLKHDWATFLLVWSFPPPTAHATWGVGFYGAQRLFSSLGCALVVYEVTSLAGVTKLDGKWTDWTRAVSWESAVFSSSLPGKVDQSLKEGSVDVSGIYNFTGGSSAATGRKPETEYSGELKIEKLKVKRATTDGTPVCEYVVLWWNFEPPDKPAVWSHRGIGCFTGKWLVAGWGSLASLVGIAHYSLQKGVAMGRFLTAHANEPAEKSSHGILSRVSLFGSKYKMMEEGTEEWKVPETFAPTFKY